MFGVLCFVICVICFMFLCGHDFIVLVKISKVASLSPPYSSIMSS